MRGSLIQRYKGSWSIILDLGYQTDPATGLRKRKQQDLDAVSVRTSDGLLVTLTKRELIRAWSEQLGGAHEDWAVDEALVKAVRIQGSFQGIQLTALELLNCARTTLNYGRQLVDLAQKRRRRTRRPRANGELTNSPVRRGTARYETS